MNRSKQAVHFFSIVYVASGQFFLKTDLAAPIMIAICFLAWAFSMPAASCQFTKIGNQRQRLVLPLIILLGIGIIGAPSHEMRDVLRDIVFVLCPLSVALFGIALASSRVRFQLVFGALLVAAIISSILQISQFISNPDLFEMDAVAIRDTVGTGVGSVVGFVLFMLYYNKNLFPKFLLEAGWLRYLILAILSFAFFVSFSRVQFVFLFILYLSVYGYITKFSFKAFVPFSILVVSLIGLTLITPSDETGTLRSKIIRTFTEITVTDTGDLKEINDNWRGYETARALDQYLGSNLTGWFLGDGFGTTVDIGLDIVLGDDYMRFIPVFHNGYIYILLKTGGVGFLLYIIFFSSFIRPVGKYLNDAIEFRKQNSRIILGCLLGVVMLTYVVHGVTQFSDMYLVLIISYISTALLVDSNEC